MQWFEPIWHLENTEPKVKDFTFFTCPHNSFKDCCPLRQALERVTTCSIKAATLWDQSCLELNLPAATRLHVTGSSTPPGPVIPPFWLYWRNNWTTHLMSQHQHYGNLQRPIWGSIQRFLSGPLTGRYNRVHRGCCSVEASDSSLLA